MENKELELMESFEVEELEDRLEFKLWGSSNCYDSTYTSYEMQPLGISDSGIGIWGTVAVEHTVTICN